MRFTTLLLLSLLCISFNLYSQAPVNKTPEADYQYLKERMNLAGKQMVQSANLKTAQRTVFILGILFGGVATLSGVKNADRDDDKISGAIITGSGIVVTSFFVSQILGGAATGKLRKAGKILKKS